ncbi:EthD family reductase [bacterium]|nr:EthD family reductase [bacterium]
MISRLVFVAPKPNMAEADFFRYWKVVHAPLGARIPQVVGYRICCRVPVPGLPTAGPFLGAAEIWIRDAAAAVAMAQSDEYVTGARADDPHWLAFWAMVVLDTEAHVLLGDPAPGASPGGVKILALVKRKPGMSVAAFREYSLGRHAELDLRLPGLRRYVQGHLPDGWYEVGEPPFDSVAQLWFDGAAEAAAALESDANRAAAADLANFVDPLHAIPLAVDETWVVGPQFRTGAA